MSDLMRNIFTNSGDYRVFFDGVRYVVFVDTLYTCNFNSRDDAQLFLDDRLRPVDTPARVYEDICRCPKSILLWHYCKTGDLIFERCKKCRNPLRHDVMLELNRDLIQDFDLEAFLLEE